MELNGQRDSPAALPPKRTHGAHYTGWWVVPITGLLLYTGVT